MATPKENEHQSLHTSVTSPDGRHIEVKIWTHPMYKISEAGIVAYWVSMKNTNTGATGKEQQHKNSGIHH